MNFLFRFLKGMFYLVAITIFCWVGYKGFDQWQTQVAQEEKSLSPQGKLPENVSPIEYHLKLIADPNKSKFQGEANIALEIHQATSIIWLHGKDLEVTKTSLALANGEIILGKYKEMGSSGVSKIEFAKIIEPQKATLSMNYSACFSKKLNGFYTVSENNNRYAFTQFEATDARKAFPSFDEPRFKVPFNLIIETPKHNSAFANTLLLRQESLENGQVRSVFKRTKPLPTYLVAFAVGEFDVVEWAPIPKSTLRNRTIPLRGIAVKGKGKQLTYALEHTADILNTLEQYFGREYPFEKLDIVAVPDFSAGAMENAGLITYRETLLLFDQEPSLIQKQRYSSVHAHELAHQWFGNLVTMPWWDDLWLNESFATWMAQKAIAEWSPELGIQRKGIRNVHRVMDTDSYVSARQMRQPIKSNHDIENAFDSITYTKGGGVLNMFERYLGKSTFQRGIQYHMNRFAFSNATAEDFIESLIHVSGRPEIKSAFFSFLTQPGVPNIHLDWRCDENKVQIQLTQSRYHPAGTSSLNNQSWKIPVCLKVITSNNETEVCRLLKATEEQFEVTSQECPTAIFPNAKANSYYRWSVAKEHWDTLFLSMNQLSTEEKYSLFNNLDANFRAGGQSVNYLLKKAQSLVEQPEWDLQLAPIGTLEFVSERIANHEESKQLNQYLQQLYYPILEEIGLHGSSSRDKLDATGTQQLRRKLVDYMALTAMEPTIRKELLELGKQYVGFETNNEINHNIIDGDLSQIAMAVAVQEIGEPFFNHLLERFEHSNDSTFRSRALTALSHTQQPELISEVKDLVLSFDVKINEKSLLLFGMLRYPENRKKAYEWLKQYFSMLEAILPEQYLGYTPMVGAAFCDESMYNDVKAFFEPKVPELSGGPRNLQSALERIKVCVEIVRNQPELKVPSLR